MDLLNDPVSARAVIVNEHATLAAVDWFLHPATRRILLIAYLGCAHLGPLAYADAVNGEWPDLRAQGWNDRISSIYCQPSP